MINARAKISVLCMLDFVLIISQIHRFSIALADRAADNLCRQFCSVYFAKNQIKKRNLMKENEAGILVATMLMINNNPLPFKIAVTEFTVKLSLYFTLLCHFQ